MTPNEIELEELSGIKVKSLDSARLAAETLVAKGAKNVIVTLGRHGALWVNQNGGIPFDVEDIKVVDTTAAGDTFNAALAVGLAENMGIEETITFANKAARICVSRSGAQSSIPSREEVV